MKWFPVTLIFLLINCSHFEVPVDSTQVNEPIVEESITESVSEQEEVIEKKSDTSSVAEEISENVEEIESSSWLANDCGSGDGDCLLNNYLSWLEYYNFELFKAVIDEAILDEEKKLFLVEQLSVESEFLNYIKNTEKPRIQFVDVLPSNEGWSYVKITEDDRDYFQQYISSLIGKDILVELIVDYIDYEVTFSGNIISFPDWDTIIGTGYDYDDAEPGVPLLISFGVTHNASGKQTIVSASMGKKEDKAMVGSTSRDPITKDRAAIYAHELLHNFGMLHQYSNSLYDSSLNRNLGFNYLVGADCIMNDYGFGGYTDSDEEISYDSKNRVQKIHAVSPTIRYLINPTSDNLSDYVEHYESHANYPQLIYDIETFSFFTPISLNDVDDVNAKLGGEITIHITATQSLSPYFEIYDGKGEINSQTGTYSWTVDSADENEVTVIVYDGAFSDSVTFVINSSE